MPTYNVQIQINVPSVGSKTFTQTGLVAHSPEDAIALAKATIIVDVIALQKTA